MRATSSEIPSLVLDELPLLVVDENSELNTTFEKVCIDVNDRYCKILQARKYEVYGVTHSLPKYKENDRSQSLPATSKKNRFGGFDEKTGRSIGRFIFTTNAIMNKVYVTQCKEKTTIGSQRL
ncbi:MAG: hypothetical protein GY828_02325 [Candidatus Gracilibacteria bacterium]|nr:hypothetical protein [Candidatus Gracilibacteria bacterium]